MDVYGQIKIDFVLFDGGSIEQVNNNLNSYNIEECIVIAKTTCGKKFVIDSNKREVNNVDVIIEAEYDDEVC